MGQATADPLSSVVAVYANMYGVVPLLAGPPGMGKSADPHYATPLYGNPLLAPPMHGLFGLLQTIAGQGQRRAIDFFSVIDRHDIVVIIGDSRPKGYHLKGA
jgi:hypothetical protein